MAGHSKWKNIQHRKGRQDAQRGKIFTKISKEIYVAARQGGGDINTNNRLRMAVNKAREANMPNDNIERTIKKALGELDGVNYEEITYEGYGPGGVAVLVNVLTDNRNRSAAEVRHIFSKNGGNLGESGCVSFLFDRKGSLTIDKETTNQDEDEVMMAALEAGAEDFVVEKDGYQIYTTTDDFEKVKTSLESQGFAFSSVEITMVPQTQVKLTGDEVPKMLKLMDMLEDNDDVQNVYANFDIDDEELDKLGAS
ncbi:YebC/PmpR family DNA-binding transcriptional regulator [Microaerobacter geothermalis]|uniref:YebC/PmpR family DNA-binding transcriptional regulator n=1 Tax=Microaerobacter geothermalis TaxID=674972 RepID=UPI001F190B1D|nr:YebC/PmpR family DNA-binding transcriptional regulator [Microaerobacter geothermalis]MCF6092743.1 YebC/PmpR family DNA-binding transcriptional regulator [Microaerobacter geothermalis]